MLSPRGAMVKSFFQEESGCVNSARVWPWRTHLNIKDRVNTNEFNLFGSIIVMSSNEIQGTALCRNKHI